MPTESDAPPLDAAPARLPVLVAVATFGLSGVAGLGYQIAWTRLFAVGLGHEMPGLLAVVTAFFFGLALGAILLDRVIARSERPGAWYAGLELLIGVWAVAVVLLAPALNEFAASAIGAEPPPARQWAIAFGLPLVVLLPATAAMGATLPAMERLTARLTGRTTTVAGLYAANTAGAMAGILATAFIIIPVLGLRTTVFLLAAVNVGCAVAAWLVAARAAEGRPDPSAAEDVADDAGDTPETGRGGLRLATTAAFTGFLGIGFEVAGVRVIAQVLENTVYTYASTVAVFLGGTAIGAAAWQRFGPKGSFAAAATWLLQSIALGVGFGMLIMPAARDIARGVGDTASGLLGPAAGGLAGEIFVAILVFGPATIAMGAMFSHLVQSGRGRRGGIGTLAGLNTLGACAAPPIIGVVAIPAIGSGWTLTILAAGYFLLLPPGSFTRLRLAPGIATVALLILIPQDMRLVQPVTGGQHVAQYYREGVMATVSVTAFADGGRTLKVNDEFSMGGTTRSFMDRRQAHIPLMLHPNPERALFLGVGAGLTAGAATTHGDLEVTAVELVPEVVDVLEAFEPMNRAGELDRVVVADARRFVRSSDESWDVIIADLFHPARDGAGGLYTREHFEAIRRRLAPGGLVCQWLPMHQLSGPTAGTVIRTFRSVFPNASGWIAHYNPRSLVLGLVATIGPDGPEGEDPPPVDVDEAGTRLPGRAAARDRGGLLLQDLTETALTVPLNLTGTWVLSPEGLERLAGDGPINLDDRPVVTFTAPWYTYATVESALVRTDEILAAAGTPVGVDGTIDESALESASPAVRHRAARDAFLRFGQADTRGDVAAADRALIDAARISRDFTVAITIARNRWRQRMQTDPEGATALIRELEMALLRR